MFNRDGMRQQSVSPHNIYETMSRSMISSSVMSQSLVNIQRYVYSPSKRSSCSPFCLRCRCTTRRQCFTSWKLSKGMSMVFNFTNIGHKESLAVQNTKWRVRVFYGLRL